jgi:drug/metabolite transporter (DMT)-like permease
MQTTTTKPLLLLVIGGLILSLSGVAVAYSTMGTSAMGFYRMLLGGIGLFLFALARGLPFRITGVGFVYACLAGFALALDLYWWHKSIRMVGLGLGAILTNCQSFFLAVLAYLIFKERITLVYFFSLLTAAIGILMISSGGLIVPGSSGLDWVYLRGLTFGLASAVAYALCVVFIKIPQSTARHGTDPVINMIVLCGAGAIFLLVAAIFEGESIVIPNVSDGITLLLYGLVVQAVAWLMVSTAVPQVKASLAALILLAEPIGTYIIDMLYFSARGTCQ